MSLRTTSDEELLVRVRHHHEPALGELLVRYYTRLAEFAYSLLRQRDLADEAVINVFLNLWRRREKLVVNGQVRSYLFAAVGNQSLNLKKRHRRHAAVWIDTVPPGKLIGPETSTGDLIYAELRAEVDQLILTLPPRRQLIFRMNRLEGMKYAKIAKALGVSERTVQNHMIAAFRQLAAQLPQIRRTLRR